MGKDIRLVNIYLKIHNKKVLTLDDLAYLAEYAPECFEKTCKNVVYNIPETKPVMAPVVKPEEEKSLPVIAKEGFSEVSEDPEWKQVKLILNNLKRLEINDFPVESLDVGRVKSLLGDLYMELMFPHNGKNTFMDMGEDRKKSSFDQKI